MTKLYEPVDDTANRLSVGDKVLLSRVPDKLLSGLPHEDQSAIKAQIGNVLTISSFDDYGHAEIEFTDVSGAIHTIWIEPNCLRKQK